VRNKVIISDSTFDSLKSNEGAAIKIDNSDLFVENCVFKNNTAT